MESLHADIRKQTNSDTGKEFLKWRRGCQKLLEQGIDVVDDWEENPVVYPEDVLWIVSQPYVRETPKIGRNDPCPCGSRKNIKSAVGEIFENMCCVLVKKENLLCNIQ